MPTSLELQPTLNGPSCELVTTASPVVHCLQLGRVDFPTLTRDDALNLASCPNCGGNLAAA